MLINNIRSDDGGDECTVIEYFIYVEINGRDNCFINDDAQNHEEDKKQNGNFFEKWRHCMSATSPVYTVYSHQ